MGIEGVEEEEKLEPRHEDGAKSLHSRVRIAKGPSRCVHSISRFTLGGARPALDRICGAAK